MRRLAASLVALALIVLAVIFRHRLAGDFWPPDRSLVGPNLLASLIQAAALFIVAVLLYPPWRARVHRLIDRKLAPLHERLTGLHERHDEHAEHLERITASLDELHEKLGRSSTDREVGDHPW